MSEDHYCLLISASAPTLLIGAAFFPNLPSRHLYEFLGPTVFQRLPQVGDDDRQRLSVALCGVRQTRVVIRIAVLFQH